ncbi:MAG: site-specific integrase [Candidatus Ratteibacteria bacterium]|nr:site-specific integrase [Candidatus Ratteibacteria bacterium]
MSVYIRCPHCKTDQNYQYKRCKKCFTPLPAKDRTYRVVVWHRGKVVTQVVPYNLQLAKKIEAKLKSELVSGSYYPRKTKTCSLNDIASKYLEEYKARGGKTWQGEMNRYNLWFKTRLGNDGLDKITPSDVEKFKLELSDSITRRGTPATPKTVKNALELLSRLFNYAIRMELYDGNNPVKKITRPKVNNAREIALTQEQAVNLINVLNEYPDNLMANLVKLALFTGMRKNELLKLKWRDVDLKKGFIYIRNPKSGRDEVIPLNDSAIEIIKDQRKLTEEDELLVFPNKKGYVIQNIRRPWERIKKLTGLSDDFRFHDLRHTYASLLASSGKVDIYTLQKLLTHKSPQMTQRYAHLIEQRLRDGTKVMDDVIGKGEIED